MAEQNIIEIPLSKGKLIKLLSFSIAFLLLGFWLAFYHPRSGNPVFDSELLKYVIGVLGMVMGLVGIFFFSKKILDTKAGLTIDDSGIIENGGALSVGHIPWADIIGIRETAVQTSIASKQKFIVIVLRDPQVYIDRETSSIKRKLMSVNTKSSGSPVNISTNGLKIKHEDLKKLLIEKYEHYRSRGF